MHHIAIMKASWHMTEKIARGEKTIESRWFKRKTTPWNKIKPGDRIFFKESGGPITVSAIADRIEYIERADGEKIIAQYGRELCLNAAPKDRPFVILIFLKEIRSVRPFHISKEGFGTMAAWICVDRIDSIRVL